MKVLFLGGTDDGEEREKSSIFGGLYYLQKDKSLSFQYEERFFGKFCELCATSGGNGASIKCYKKQRFTYINVNSDRINEFYGCLI